MRKLTLQGGETDASHVVLVILLSNAELTPVQDLHWDAPGGADLVQVGHSRVQNRAQLAGFSATFFVGPRSKG